MSTPYNSNHLEGSTLTYGQTELLLTYGIVSGEGPLWDFSEMKASQAGLLMVRSAALSADTPLTQLFIRQLHRTILREDYTVYRTLPGGAVTSYVIHAGQYKTRPCSVVTVTGERSDYASAEETPSLMADLTDWYNKVEQNQDLHPVQLAALFHYRFIRIHPFDDGNGRMTRLLVNWILARHGWPMIVIRNRKKAEYLKALHQADRTSGKTPSHGAHAAKEQIRPFMTCFMKIVEAEMNYQIAFIENRNPGAWWFDGEPLRFRSPNAARVLTLLRDRPYITFAELSEATDINVSALQKLTGNMVVKGYLQRRGDKAPRSWMVLASQSD